MQTSEWICNKLGVEVATNFEWKLQQSTKCGWKLWQPAVGGCYKLRSEVATNCVWKVATKCEWNLQQSTNCVCKLQRTAIWIRNQLRLQSPQTTNCCGWKLKLQRTAVGRCKCRKLLWEDANNCKRWKLQQTTKREVVTNFFPHVFFKTCPFNTCSFKTCSSKTCSFNCSWKLQQTEVESCNKLQPETANDWSCNKLQNVRL